MSYKKSSCGAAITAIYIALGMQKHIEPAENYEEIADTLGGHIGIMGMAAELAEASEEWLEAHNVEDFDGVYDYDVSEPFGTWLGEQLVKEPTFPTSAAREELHRRIEEFFK
jgi:hypothetical protein